MEVTQTAKPFLLWESATFCQTENIFEGLQVSLLLMNSLNKLLVKRINSFETRGVSETQGS